ncbi:arylsulfatase [Clostridium sp. CAG:609]|nr:arylsulfatase [Clostridium sp. CAG:609]
MKKEKIIKFIKKYYYILILAIPFILIDLFTRYKVEFYGLFKPVPNLFTILWIFLVLALSLFTKKRLGKIIYSIFFIISLAIYLVNNIYFSMTGVFFDFSMVLLASEGSSYLLDSIKNCNSLVYLLLIPIIFSFFVSLKVFPKHEKGHYKALVISIFAFIILHSITPVFLGKANEELTWSTWRNPRNIYISFNDNNKSLKVSGLYEYTARGFYMTFLKSKQTVNEQDIAFLKEEYSKENDKKKNRYTGKQKGNNLIIVQLEGVDSWLINKNDTPTLYNMMRNSINFTNHYSYYNGGGSTFNSEFAVNTGFITPLSYTQNAYTFNKNSFPYSLAHLFKNEGYSVNAFHMNTKEFYSRGTNYKNWGYDNYYGLVDLGTYKDNSYYLDRELILNEDFNEKMFSDKPFVDYIITYTNHMPFSSEKGNCKMLLDLDSEENENVSYDLNEEDCARRQAKETDYMMELLLNELKTRNLYNNTTIVVLTDHYLYTLSDKTILDKYKNTSNNLINYTPFFIWNNGKDKKTVKTVTSQLNVLPTILNLFGIDYNPVNYIGSDALDNNYQKIVFFSDYSWYDGNVYVDGGIVTNKRYISEEALDNKNYYVNYLIKKNDLTLKYNYFKELEKSSK